MATLSKPSVSAAFGGACLLLGLIVTVAGAAPQRGKTAAYRPAEVKAAAEVTYARDVAPIFDSQCVSCHHTGEVAPFALTDYATAKDHADMIAQVTASRVMPPWHAAKNFGEFAGERHLSDVQIATLKKWEDEGEPEGNPKDAPPSPSFPAGWTLGKPDLVLQLPEAFHIPAGGNDIYQCFVLPTNIVGDRFVSAIDFRPGNMKVLHHAIVYLDNRHVAREMLDKADPGHGFRSFGGPGFLPTGVLGGWVPGSFARFWQPGIAEYMAAGSDVVVQIHYHPSGKPETDRSQLAIYFSKEPVHAVTTDIPLWQPKIDIPAGDSNYSVTQDFTIPTDCEAVGILPHMHLIGRQMQVTAVLPDGTVKPMVWVKNWNFNWQDQYRYKTPVDLPAGTRLIMNARYDNSEANPFNPSTPPKEVHFGEQTTDEMALCVVEVIAKRPDQRQVVVRSVLRKYMGIGRALNSPI